MAECNCAAQALKWHDKCQTSRRIDAGEQGGAFYSTADEKGALALSHAVLVCSPPSLSALAHARPPLVYLDYTTQSASGATTAEVGMEVQPLAGGEGRGAAAAVQGFVTRVHSTGLCDVKYSGEDKARRSEKKLKLRSDRLYAGMRVEALVHRDGDRSLEKKGSLEWSAATVEMAHGSGMNYDVRLAKSGKVASHLRRECVVARVFVFVRSSLSLALSLSLSLSLSLACTRVCALSRPLSHHPHLHTTAATFGAKDTTPSRRAMILSGWQ